MTDIDIATFEFIREQLAVIVPFATHVGVDIVELGDGTARATLSEEPFTLNHVGTQHAGVLYTVAEAASGAAMAGAMAPFVLEAVSVVKTSSARYVRPARGTISASARSQTDGPTMRERYAADGRVDFSLDVVLTDDSDEAVAEMSFEWSCRAPR